MFPIGEAKFLAGTKLGFGATSSIKQQRRLCGIWGGAALVAAGGVNLRNYGSDGGGGGGKENMRY